MKLLYSILLALIMLAGIALPVLAIADPDSTPQINAVYVYEDTYATGDIGVLVDINIDYATNPDETATEAYLVAFIDTDGTTQLRAVAPYSYYDDGYSRQLVWIRFTAAEVSTYSITSANSSAYKIWLMGNPTLSWSGDPPKVEGSVDYWQPSGASASTLIALRVLYYAREFTDTSWTGETLYQNTALGYRLTTSGETYFEGVITSLRDIAPTAFASGEFDPTIPSIDYTTSFGATMTDGSGTVVGSPITLAEGNNTVNVTGTGTFTFALNRGTSGNITDDTGTVTGSPVDLVFGTNTVNVTGAGLFTVYMELIDTTGRAEEGVEGTGFDLTEPASRFGMTRWMFSGLIWMALGVVLCSAVYGGGHYINRRTGIGYTHRGLGGGQTVMIALDFWIIAGGVMGLLQPLVAILMFIAWGTLTGYVIFFRRANV